MQLKINGKIFNFEQGQTVLNVCRANEIKIPTLCYHEDLLPAEGLCRLCLVKTDKQSELVTSCQMPAQHLMEVITEDEEIEKARRFNLELLWADHVGKCINCQKNGNCELQNLARDFKIDISDFVPSVSKFEKEEQLKILKESMKNRIVDDGNPAIFRDNQYCVECGRCIKACRDIQTVEEYGMHNRSIETSVGTSCGLPMDCIFCGQCAIYCPTAAILEKDEIKKLDQLLNDKTKLKVLQVAPSVRFTIGESFGYEPGENVEKKVAAALRKLGADLIFDTTFSADLTIMEEANELVERLHKFLSGDKDVRIPMFTSCCPSWVLYIEKYWPQFIGHLSSAKSPMQMLGATIKTFYCEKKKINNDSISSIAVMPCTSKKFEAAREEMGRDGIADIDLVVTTRELVRYLQKKQVLLNKVKDGEFDQSLGVYSGAGVIFGSTGGVMEAALRTAYESLTCEELPKLDFQQVRGMDGVREAEITIPKGKCNAGELKIKVAVVHEIRNAKKVMEALEKGECEYHFVEVMACPGGCLGGGGQPIPTNAKIRQKRMEGIYKRDKEMPLRKSHDNPAIKKLYEDYLQHPGGELSEKYLHTHYFDRSKK